MSLTKPSDVGPVPKRDAGGDNTVPRDKKDRPRIIVDCWLCDGTGKVPSKKTGNPTKCQGCGKEGLSAGKRYKSYTRTTTYIDVIEDKSNLQAWGERMVLLGVARDPKFLDGVTDMDPRREEKEVKDELNRRAQAAKKIAGSEEKADKGTFLHGLSELVDEDQPLPPGISFEDVVDMDAYRRATRFFKIIHMEKLVVHDEYQIGGTPDRVSTIDVEAFTNEFAEMMQEHGGLVAPDGSVIKPGELVITDLKTGTVEYGALKMCMQLAIYSRSKLYCPKTGERTSLGPINQKWGIIMNLPAGSGECTLYWADLDLGWFGVEVAKQVRELRSRSSKSLQVLVRENMSAGASLVGGGV